MGHRQEQGKAHAPWIYRAEPPGMQPAPGPASRPPGGHTYTVAPHQPGPSTGAARAAEGQCSSSQPRCAEASLCTGAIQPHAAQKMGVSAPLTS